MQLFANHRSKHGYYPVFYVIATTTLTLLIIGLLGLLLLHTHKFLIQLRENVRIHMYLHQGTPESSQLRIGQILHKQPFTHKKDGISQVRYVSKEESAQQFIRETEEDFLQILEENPLRDAYVVQISPAYQEDYALKIVKKKLAAMQEVFEVCYVEDFASSVSKNADRISVSLLILSIVLLAVVSVLIHNTIKLAVYSQRFLIRSMELVGATPSFIRRPFLVRAVLTGLISGTIVNSTLLLLLHYANTHIVMLAPLQNPIHIFLLLSSIYGIGLWISLLSTYWTIGRYLHTSLDNLY